MSLFRDFSFEAPPRQPEQHYSERVAASVSPTSTSMSPSLLPARLPTPPPCSIGDLTQALRKQDLRVLVDPRFKATNEPLTPPDDHVAFSHALPEWPRLSLSTARINCATLRMQRQEYVRMQSSPSHVKDISTLVEKMVEEEDQCSVKRKTKPPPPTTVPGEDEGVSMSYTPSVKEEMRTLLPCYRASDCVDGSARVLKRRRMRRSTVTRISKRSWR